VSTSGGIETEIKLRLRGDANTGQQLLLTHGFSISVDRVFEANSVYDTATDTLRSNGQLLRLRLAGSVVTLTWKGPAKGSGPHKSRPETEVQVDNFERASELLVSLGYRVRFRYDKYRTEFTRAGEHGTATLDETPIGTLLELEGEPDWIDATAAQLGFKPEDYITSSYGALYQQYREQHPEAPEFMTFLSDQALRS